MNNLVIFCWADELDSLELDEVKSAHRFNRTGTKVSGPLLDIHSVIYRSFDTNSLSFRKYRQNASKGFVVRISSPTQLLACSDKLDVILPYVGVLKTSKYWYFTQCCIQTVELVAIFAIATGRLVYECSLFNNKRDSATQETIEHRLQIRNLRQKIDGLDVEYENICKQRTVPLKEFRYSKEVMEVSDAFDKYLRLQLNVESVDKQFHEARRTLNAEIEALEGNQSKTKRTYVLACIKANCKGMLSSENINQHGHYICSICSGTTCNGCKMEIESVDHKCDPDILKTVKFMDTSTKPCPSCGIPIHKISGCFSAGTIIPLANGTNVSAYEVEVNHQLIGDDGTKRTVKATMTGTDQLYQVNQSDGCSYEVNTYHTLCLMKDNHGIILMTVNIYLELDDEEKKNLFGYKIVDGMIKLSQIEITPTRVGRYYGFTLSDNQRFVLQDGTVAHNCSQMFCTSCHASFDWNSLCVNNGAIHNPHAAEWMRANRNRTREVGDIPCGREITMPLAVDMVTDFESAIGTAKLNKSGLAAAADEVTYLFEALRFSIHHTYVTIPALSRNQHGHHTNQSLRIDLWTNSMDEFEFKREIQHRDKSTSKRNDLLQVTITYRDALTDIIFPFVGTRKTYTEWAAMVMEVHALESYVDECFSRVGDTTHASHMR